MGAAMFYSPIQIILLVVILYSGKVWQRKSLANLLFLSIWYKMFWQINRSAKRLLIVSTNIIWIVLVGQITNDSPNFPNFPIIQQYNKYLIYSKIKFSFINYIGFCQHHYSDIFQFQISSVISLCVCVCVYVHECVCVCVQVCVYMHTCINVRITHQKVYTYMYPLYRKFGREIRACIAIVHVVELC